MIRQSVKEKYYLISYVESDEHNKLMNKIVTEARYIKQTDSCWKKGGMG